MGTPDPSGSNRGEQATVSADIEAIQCSNLDIEKVLIAKVPAKQADVFKDPFPYVEEKAV
jgi:hypothetical protein